MKWRNHKTVPDPIGNTKLGLAKRQIPLMPTGLLTRNQPSNKSAFNALSGCNSLHMQLEATPTAASERA